RLATRAKLECHSLFEGRRTRTLRAVVSRGRAECAQCPRRAQDPDRAIHSIRESAFFQAEDRIRSSNDGYSTSKMLSFPSDYRLPQYVAQFALTKSRRQPRGSKRFQGATSSFRRQVLMLSPSVVYSVRSASVKDC